MFGAGGQGAKGTLPLIQRAAGAACFHLKPGFEGAVGIRLVNGRQMRQINRLHRGVDRPTDVLSFHMMDYDRGKPGFDPELEAEMPGGVIMMGDILISVEQAAKQAEAYGHSFKRACAYLTVHRMLPLMGFDLEAEEDKTLMRSHEEAVLAYLGLDRHKMHEG